MTSEELAASQAAADLSPRALSMLRRGRVMMPNLPSAGDFPEPRGEPDYPLGRWTKPMTEKGAQYVQQSPLDRLPDWARPEAVPLLSKAAGYLRPTTTDEPGWLERLGSYARKATSAIGSAAGSAADMAQQVGSIAGQGMGGPLGEAAIAGVDALRRAGNIAGNALIAPITIPVAAAKGAKAAAERGEGFLASQLSGLEAAGRHVGTVLTGESPEVSARSILDVVPGLTGVNPAVERIESPAGREAAGMGLELLANLFNPANAALARPMSRPIPGTPRILPRSLSAAELPENFRATIPASEAPPPLRPDLTDVARSMEAAKAQTLGEDVGSTSAMLRQQAFQRAQQPPVGALEAQYTGGISASDKARMAEAAQNEALARLLRMKPSSVASVPQIGEPAAVPPSTARAARLNAPATKPGVEIVEPMMRGEGQLPPGRIRREVASNVPGFIGPQERPTSAPAGPPRDAFAQWLTETEDRLPATGVEARAARGPTASTGGEPILISGEKGPQEILRPRPVTAESPPSAGPPGPPPQTSPTSPPAPQPPEPPSGVPSGATPVLTNKQAQDAMRTLPRDVQDYALGLARLDTAGREPTAKEVLRYADVARRLSEQAKTRSAAQTASPEAATAAPAPAASTADDVLSIARRLADAHRGERGAVTLPGWEDIRDLVRTMLGMGEEESMGVPKLPTPPPARGPAARFPGDPAAAASTSTDMDTLSALAGRAGVTDSAGMQKFLIEQGVAPDKAASVARVFRQSSSVQDILDNLPAPGLGGQRKRGVEETRQVVQSPDVILGRTEAGKGIYDAITAAADAIRVRGGQLEDAMKMAAGGIREKSESARKVGTYLDQLSGEQTNPPPAGPTSKSSTPRYGVFTSQAVAEQAMNRLAQENPLGAPYRVVQEPVAGWVVGDQTFDTRQLAETAAKHLAEQSPGAEAPQVVRQLGARYAVRGSREGWQPPSPVAPDGAPIVRWEDLNPGEQRLARFLLEEYYPAFREQLGLTPEQSIIGYGHPHIWDKATLTREFGAELKTLSETKVPDFAWLPEADRPSAAARWETNRQTRMDDLQDILSGRVNLREDVPRTLFFGNLLPREGRAGYTMDALTAAKTYERGALRKIYMEPAAREALELLPRLDPQMQSYGKWYLRNILGMENSWWDTAASTVNSLEYILRLGFNVRAIATHISRSINMPVEAGPTWAARGYAMATGLDRTELADGARAAWDRGYYMRGFTQWDRGPVRGAIDATQRTALWLFRKFNDGMYRTAFMAGYAKGASEGLTGPALEQYAADLMWRTEFRFGPENMPHFFQTPAGRVLGQFQSPRVKQAEFIGKLWQDDPLKVAGYALAAGGALVGGKTLLGVDLTHGLSLLGNVPESGRAIKALVQGDPEGFLFHLGQSGLPFIGSLAGQGPSEGGLMSNAPAVQDVATLGHLALKSISDEGVGSEVRQLQPTALTRLQDLLRGRQSPQVDEETGRTTYPIYSSGGQMKYTLTPYQSYLRAFGPKPEGETQQQNIIAGQMASRHQIAGLRKQYYMLRQSGDEDQADALNERYGLFRPGEGDRYVRTRQERLSTPLTELLSRPGPRGPSPAQRFYFSQTGEVPPEDVLNMLRRYDGGRRPNAVAP